MNDSSRLYFLTLTISILSFSTIFTSCNSGGTDAPSATQADTAKTTTGNDSLAQPVDSFSQQLDTFAVGDINGDGKKDTAYLTGPQYSQQEMKCKDSCMSIVTFGDSIKPLVVGPNIGGTLYPIADMDGNGTEDLIFAPDWFSSCWSAFYVYSLKDTGWQELAYGNYYFCDTTLGPAKRVRKLNNGYLEIISDTMTISDILPVRHQVKLP